MLIQKKRIRNIDNYIPNFDGRDIYIAHSLPDAGKTDSIGFSSQRQHLKKLHTDKFHGLESNGSEGAQLKKLLTLVKLSISATRESSPLHQA